MVSIVLGLSLLASIAANAWLCRRSRVATASEVNDASMLAAWRRESDEIRLICKSVFGEHPDKDIIWHVLRLRGDVAKMIAARKTWAVRSRTEDNRGA